jgi:hypothetical protein
VFKRNKKGGKLYKLRKRVTDTKKTKRETGGTKVIRRGYTIIPC